MNALIAVGLYVVGVLVWMWWVVRNAPTMPDDGSDS